MTKDDATEIFYLLIASIMFGLVTFEPMFTWVMLIFKILFYAMSVILLFASIQSIFKKKKQ